MEFKDVIKQLRKEKKLKQWEIAELFNVDRTTVGKWETGNNKPNADMLVLIADYFGVSTDYLLGISNVREESPNKKEPINTDGLSDNKKALITFAKTVPEDKAAMILQVMKSIVEAE